MEDIDALRAALRWLYDVPQAEGAVIHPLGAGMVAKVPALDRWFHLEVTPERGDWRPTLTWRPADVGVQVAIYAARLAPFTATEFAALSGSVDRALRERPGLRAESVANELDGIVPTLRVVLSVPPCPSLRQAIRRYIAGCPEHGDNLLCACGWLARGAYKARMPWSEVDIASQ